jgi:hypothetical protein
MKQKNIAILQFLVLLLILLNHNVYAIKPDDGQTRDIDGAVDESVAIKNDISSDDITTINLLENSQINMESTQDSISFPEAVKQNLKTFLIIVVGIVGSVASITSLLYSIFSRKRSNRLLKFVEMNVDKSITEETLERKKSEVSFINRKITNLNRQIRLDIPIAARRATLQDRLQALTEELTKSHYEIINIKRELMALGDRSDLADEILVAVKHEVQPNYLIKERIARYKTVLTVLASAAALFAAILPFEGRLIAIVLIGVAIPIGLRVLIDYKKSKVVPRLTKLKSTKSPKKAELFVDRIRLLSKEQMDVEIDSLIADNIYVLSESEEVANGIADTNAFDWMVDDYEMLGHEFDDEKINVRLTFHCSGDADVDKPFCGDEIEGEARAEITQQGTVTFEEISAQVQDYT